MREQLICGLTAIAKEDYQAIEDIAAQIKELPRRENGRFDLSAIDGNAFAAAGYVYPVYAAYETECNKKEGYPDLLQQMKTLHQELQGDETLENTAYFLDALIDTAHHVSPQLYEYYRELGDMFKAGVREAVLKFWMGDCFGEAGKKEPALSSILQRSIAKGADAYILLREKYEQYL